METRYRCGGHGAAAGSQHCQSGQELRSPRHWEANGLLRENQETKVNPAADVLTAVVKIKDLAGSVVFALL